MYLNHLLLNLLINNKQILGNRTGRQLGRLKE